MPQIMMQLRHLLRHLPICHFCLFRCPLDKLWVHLQSDIIFIINDVEDDAEMNDKRVMKNNQRLKVAKKSIWKDRGSWSLLLLCLPAIIGYILFNYIPIAVSITIPFRDYKFSQGILGSAFVGLKNFKWIFGSSNMLEIIRNTALYGLWFMIICPIVNVILALLLFEVRSRKALKAYQTIISFPNFMSMVIVGFITYAILSPMHGVMNQIITGLGGEAIDVYTKPEAWPGILTVVTIWKGIGMGSMMYFASLMGVDP